MLKQQLSGTGSLNTSYPPSHEEEEIKKIAHINAEFHGKTNEKNCLEQNLCAAIVYGNKVIMYNREACSMIPLIQDIFRSPFRYFNRENELIEAKCNGNKTYEVTVWDIGMGQRLVTLHDKMIPTKIMTSRAMADSIKILREHKNTIDDKV